MHVPVIRSDVRVLVSIFGNYRQEDANESATHGDLRTPELDVASGLKYSCLSAS